MACSTRAGASITKHAEAKDSRPIAERTGASMQHAIASDQLLYFRLEMGVRVGGARPSCTYRRPQEGESRCDELAFRQRGRAHQNRPSGWERRAWRPIVCPIHISTAKYERLPGRRHSSNSDALSHGSGPVAIGLGELPCIDDIDDEMTAVCETACVEGRRSGRPEIIGTRQCFPSSKPSSRCSLLPARKEHLVGPTT